ncbi:hypothetical protein MMG00_09860 [Ignatzschineria rhizosphaerae]|uniref:CopG-like ribbon-helix-helix domain-containing protein n=1 Tax=Ignatzschineria rhizosphaerae TaxID=2923279 RepID=A0ABY3WZR4_9GAMM|nr:hypothetical protein [Ignatzschineria rhizosphaerae]UNM95525.1 hypothetical protein MMG00_09860 [Ignatzschineria rhizosphaerae]
MHKQKKNEQKTLSIRFDLSIYEQLKELAEKEGRSIGGQARIFIAQGLDEDRQKAEV